MPRDRAQRVEIRPHDEVPVAALPGGHLVALDRLHVDVDGEQVVAGLGVALGDVIEEVGRGHPLSLETALHVGDRQKDGVDLPGVDLCPQFVERHERAGYTR
jgi:hypothetical protein